ncbi:MAG: response regulator transcription factor [Clostridia bacterium]|nr:response regulator transcription factor [Clostridia bacterium]MBQ6076521.1 response regulator transcription factor [Clostridia bacterium]MBR0437132.1 response regulator transcription factor [Clostridia bacterium]MBR2644511.1 response regulator transcription factor [Clostridia bacterium]MBR3037611.1 response regulator transcription factor [Clostridia bacterium]
MALVYIVEDDIDIREMETYALKSAGLSVDAFADSERFFETLAVRLPDMVLLDIMLPGRDGLEVLKELRESPATQTLPIMMVTAKTSEADRVKGLDSGADDYLIKPFGIMELVSRCKALLRRANRLMPVLAYETIEMDDDRHRVTADGVDVELTFKEYALLKYLLENSGTAVTRERLMDAVWGFAFTGETRTVDMHIKTLRKKLGPSGALILTVRNVGYQLGR